MRKIVSILLVLFCGLYFAAGSPAVEPARVSVSAAITVDDSVPAEWLCERACNSDLNLPGVCGGNTAAPAADRLRSSGSADTRAAVRHLSALYDAGIPKETQSCRIFHPFAETHAVDYYVYRLRRLLI